MMPPCFQQMETWRYAGLHISFCNPRNKEIKVVASVGTPPGFLMRFSGKLLASLYVLHLCECEHKPAGSFIFPCDSWNIQASKNCMYRESELPTSATKRSDFPFQILFYLAANLWIEDDIIQGNRCIVLIWLRKEISQRIHERDEIKTQKNKTWGLAVEHFTL